MASKKKITLIFILLYALILGQNSTKLKAQSYSNAWIKYGQPYIRLAVMEKGIQRISFSKLTAAGFPVSDSDKFHLYFRGNEISIISTSNKEIVFYGEPNDGGQDSLLFRPTSSRTNIYHSIYSNEGSYYLTVSSSSTQLSEKYSEANNTSLTPEPYHLKTEINSYKGQFSQSPAFIEPSLLQSIFLDGKGWTDTLRVAGEASETNARFPFQLKNRVTVTSLPPKLQLLIYGRSNTDHNIQVLVGQNNASLRNANSVLNFSLFTSKKTEFNILNSDITTDGKGVLGFQSKSSGTKDTYSLTYFNLIYPQSFDMTGQTASVFTLIPTKNTLSRIQIPNAPSSARIFDLTDKLHPKEITGQFNNNVLEVMVRRKTDLPLTLFVTSEIKDIASEKLTNTNFTNYNPKDYNYIIISNTTLFSVAQQYAAYRASAAGGNYKPLLINIKDIYTQFNYGEPSPLGIRRFVDYMISDGNTEKNLLLIGRSTSYASLIEKTLKELPEDVPTIGYPGADILLVEGLAGNPQDVPAISVGRISALLPDEVSSYLSKIQAYEQDNSVSSWRKRVLHMSGGKSPSELTMLKGSLESLTPLVVADGGSVEAVTKQSLIEVEPVNVSVQVNNGVGLMTYFGHGSPTTTDLDMGYASDPLRGFSNKDKYPVMYFNGCGVGDIFASWTNTLALDWLFTKDKGAIGVVSNSHYSYYSSTDKYLNFYYSKLFDNNSPPKSIGQVQKEVAQSIMSSNPSLYDVVNLHQTILMGDPVIKIFRYENVDYSVTPSDLFLRSRNTSTTLAKTDTVVIGAIISNLGKYQVNQLLPVSVSLQYSNGQTIVKKLSINSFQGQDTVMVSVLNTFGLQKVEVVLDPDSTLTEISKANNKAIIKFDWDSIKELTTYPKDFTADLLAPALTVNFDNRIIENNETVTPDAVLNISLVDENLLLTDSSSVDLYIKPCLDDACGYKRISYDQLSLSSISDRQLEVNYKLSNLTPGTYQILVVGKDLKGNVINYRIIFNIAFEKRSLKVTVSPNPATDFVHFTADNYIEDFAPDEIEYSIYNLSGSLIDHQTIKSVKQGINEWYWYPKSASGNYVYKITFHWKDRDEILSGKIIILR